VVYALPPACTDPDQLELIARAMLALVDAA
jgi:hypothetical protein